MESKVSIIVPVYNSENFLTKCVNSILQQSYKNIELILVDDESPDKSGEICDRYAQEDHRVVTIHKSNGGTCEARNVGLDHATGKYLMFADGDDWMEKNCVSYLVSLMQKTQSEMAMTDCIFTTRKCSLQGTTQSRYLTGGIPPVRLSTSFSISLSTWASSTCRVAILGFAFAAFFLPVSVL